jgi:hypothetical protein
LRGISVERARLGLMELDALFQQARKGHRPSDGFFVSFWRLIYFQELESTFRPRSGSKEDNSGRCSRRHQGGLSGRCHGDSRLPQVFGDEAGQSGRRRRRPQGNRHQELMDGIHQPGVSSSSLPTRLKTHHGNARSVECEAGCRWRSLPSWRSTSARKS